MGLGGCHPDVLKIGDEWGGHVPDRAAENNRDFVVRRDGSKNSSRVEDRLVQQQAPDIASEKSIS